MAADSGLGEEKIVSRLRETFQISDAAESFQMSKFNLQWFAFHYGQDIKPIFLEMQVKISFSKIEFNS